LTTTLEDAVALEAIVKKTKRFMGVNYTYSGYPMVHEAREMVAAGLLGAIRVVQVEYPLEWMATAIETQGNAQAAWRTDPKKSGRGGPSQVAIGCSNGVRLRVFGEKGSLTWFQEQPNELEFTKLMGRTERIMRGADDLSESAKVRTRTPPGHPEG